MQHTALDRPSVGPRVSRIVKLLAGTLLLAGIVYQVGSHFDNGVAPYGGIDLAPLDYVLLVTAVFLVPVNWSLEALKWRVLLSSSRDLSFLQSAKAICIGAAAGIITPANVGDYGGRLAVLRREEYAVGIAATLISSICQNLWNVGLGIIAVSVFLYSTELQLLDYTWLFEPRTMSIVAIATILLSGVAALLYNWVQVYPIMSRIRLIVNTVRQSSGSSLRKAVQYSLLRYMVYVAQYVLLLYVFGVDLPIMTLMMGTAVIYLIQTGVPLPPALGMLARTEVAILVWGLVEVSPIPVLTASLSLWMINKVAISIAGALLVMR